MVDTQHFDWLCDSPVFVRNLSRNTKFSDVLTPCISYALLNTLSLLFTLGTLPYLLVYSRLTPYPQLKCTKLLVYKWALTVIFVLISALSLLVTSLFATEDYLLKEYRYAAICDALTSIGLTVLQYVCFKNGIVSSGCIAVTWLLRLFASSAQMALWLTGVLGDQLFASSIATAVFIVSFQAVVCHCFADQLDQDYKAIPENENRSPELSSSFLCRHVYWFVNHVLWDGFRRKLDYSDFWTLNDRDKTGAVSVAFDDLLRHSQKKFAEARSKWLASERDPKKKPKPPTIFIPLLRATWKPTAAALMLSVFEIALYSTAPFIVGLIVRSVVADWPFWLAVGAVVLLFVTRLTNDLVTVAEERYTWTRYSSAKTILTNAVYKKMIQLSAASRATVSAGQIINLISVDSERIKVFWYELTRFYYHPAVMIIGSISIYQVLGMSALIGLACMCICIPISAYLYKMEGYNEVC